MTISARRAAVILLGLLCFALVILMSGCTLGQVAVDDAPPPFQGPPLIRIASPLPNQTFLAGATVIVQARIENAGPDLARISISLDGVVLGERLNPNPSGAAAIPVTMDWPTSSPGQFEFAVEAARADGTIARETVSLSVILESAPVIRAQPAESAPDGDRADQSRQQADDSAIDVPAVSTSVIASPPPAASATDILPSGSIAIPAVITVPSNLRLGPGTDFELVGSIAVGEAVEIVSVNDARDWYHIRYGEQGDAWIYSELLKPDGDLSTLPSEPGPGQPTAVPAQPSGINLLIDEIILQPNPLVCNEPGSVRVVIRNAGSADTPHGGFVSFEMTHVRTGANSADGIVPRPFAMITAGATVTTEPVTVASNVFIEEEHQITASIDSQGFFTESDLSDNKMSLRFQLARGRCP